MSIHEFGLSTTDSKQSRLERREILLVCVKPKKVLLTKLEGYIMQH